MPKASEREIAIHQLILDGDDLALSKLYDLYGSDIFTSLKKKYQKQSRTDDAVLMGAVNEAFFGYYKNPRIFNPNLGTLLGFLKMAAIGDLKNIMEKSKTRTKGGEILLEDVELKPSSRNKIVRQEDGPEFQVQYEQGLDKVNEEIARYFSNETDIEICKMILRGIRETERYAEVLGVTHLSELEQRGEVKRQKDRIKGTMTRNNLEEKLKSLVNG